MVFPAKFFSEFLDLWIKDWSYVQNVWISLVKCSFSTVLFLWENLSGCKIFVKEEGLSLRCWKDLELCTGDGCKNWPERGWFHPTKSLSECLDLWSKDWFHIQIVFFFFFSLAQFHFFTFLTGLFKISLVKCSFSAVMFSWENLSGCKIC